MISPSSKLTSNMKYSKQSILVAALATLSFVSSCQKNPEVFDQTPTARLEQYLERTQQILLSHPEGWVASVYPEKTQKWGGYTALIKFTDRENCEVSNELLDADIVTQGQYKLDNSNNPSLIFSTYSRGIHIFSEPNPAGAFIGTDATEHLALGGNGDYSFQIQSVEADRIVLIGARSRSKMVLTPAAKTEWKGQIEAIQQAKALIDFPKFKITGLGEDLPGSMDLASRQLNVTIDGEDKHIPFRILDGGLELYEPLSRGGKSVQRLLVSGAATDYTLASEDGTVKLIGQEQSLQDILSSRRWILDTSHSGQRTRQGFSYAISAIQGWNSAFTIVPSARLLIQGNEGIVNTQILVRASGNLVDMPYELAIGHPAEDEVSFTYRPQSGLTGVMDILYNQLSLYMSLAGLCNLQVSVELEGGEKRTLYEDPVGPRVYKIATDSRIRPTWISLTDKLDPTNKIYLFTNPEGVPTE